MNTPDDWNAVYIDEKRVEIAELQDLVGGRRRMFAGGRQLVDVTSERIARLKRRIAKVSNVPGLSR